MICPRCGANNDNDEQFCYNCGFRLERDPQAQPSVAPVAPPQPPSYNPPGYETQQPPAYSNPGGFQPPYSGPQFAPVQPNSTAAIISLIAGIVSWLALPFVSAIVAVIAGHMARGEIRRSNGTVGGNGMALAGLILGYLNLIIVAGGVCLFIFFIVIAASNASP